MSLDDLQAQMRRALDQQFDALKREYDAAIAEARLQATAEAERRANDGIETARTEWEAVADRRVGAARAALEQQLRVEFDRQLAEAISAARNETEQRTNEAAARERVESEQQLRQQFDRQLADAVSAAQAETEQRTREAAALERREAEQQLRDDLQQQAEATAARARLEDERQITAGGTASPASDDSRRAELIALAGALRELDHSRTLSDALDVVVAQAAAIAGRSALFVIDGDRLTAWKAAGLPQARDFQAAITEAGMLARAVHAGRAVATSAELPAPVFARSDAAVPDGVAVPLMIGGRAVAVLYADGGLPPARPVAPASVELLARHASAIVSLRTATRTLDVFRGLAPDAEAGGDEQGARRFARLLVSEIKLYNEAAVHDGRRHHDLLRRLGPEIERARRLYEERVPPSIGSRHAYFQHELVQTLAEGDPALLGNP